MVSGRPGGEPGPGAHRSSTANEGGLLQLGREIDDRAYEGPVANEEGLRALGARIDRSARTNGRGGRGGRNGRVPPSPKLTRSGRPKRWSTRRKVVTGLACFLALAVLLVAAGYAYLRYEWAQVKSYRCPNCVAEIGGKPFNVLLVGSDTRAGEPPGAAQHFGSASDFGNVQHSDTIKILHVDPRTGGAVLLSIPRDTYVTMSGMPESSGLTGAQKINTSFDGGPNALTETIENTFGIPISHFVVVDFTGLINGVQSLGGINLDFRYPVRDDDNGNNNSGLNITHPGCQTLDGNMALALARSRYYQWYQDGSWHNDPQSDLGRITRQNTVIQAMIQKARGTYNPITLSSFINEVVHDISKDNSLSFGDMYDLANRYHAFSPSSLVTYTLPTIGAVTDGGADVEVVEEPQAQQTIMAFLNGAPKTPTTPPLDQYGDPINVPPPTTTTTAPPTTTQSGSSASTTPVTAPPAAKPPMPSYDPTLC